MTDGFDVGKVVLKDLDSNTLEVKSEREEAFKILKDRGRCLEKTWTFLVFFLQTFGFAIFAEGNNFWYFMLIFLKYAAIPKYNLLL